MTKDIAVHRGEWTREHLYLHRDGKWQLIVCPIKALPGNPNPLAADNRWISDAEAMVWLQEKAPDLVVTYFPPKEEATPTPATVQDPF